MNADKAGLFNRGQTRTTKKHQARIYVLGRVRHVMFVIGFGALLGACGGCGESASPVPPAAAGPSAAASQAARQAVLSTWRVFDAVTVHRELTTAAFDWAVDRDGKVWTDSCAVPSLDSATPAAGTPLPAGTHTYAVAFPNCTIDGLSPSALAGGASATYALSGRLSNWGYPPGSLDLTAQVAAQSLSGSNLAFRSDLFNVTAVGSATWSVTTTATETTRIYSPESGSTLRNNSTGNVATFGGGTLTRTWSVLGERTRFDGIVVTVGGSSYLLDGTIESTNGSQAGRETIVGEVRITSSGTVVARVYGQNGSLVVEVLAPIATF